MLAMRAGPGDSSGPRRHQGHAAFAKHNGIALDVLRHGPGKQQVLHVLRAGLLRVTTRISAGRSTWWSALCTSTPEPTRLMSCGLWAMAPASGSVMRSTRTLALALSNCKASGV